MQSETLDAFEKKLRAAREFEHTIEHEHGTATFHIRLPTPGEQRLLAGPFFEGNRIPDGKLAAFNRALAEAVVVGWNGVTSRDLLPDLPEGSDAPLGFSQTALRLVLDNRTDWQDELLQVAVAEKRRREEALEADRKNSPSGSSGKVTSARRAASKQSG